MVITGTVRQARLRPEGAECYPTFPVRVWTSAACIAKLVRIGCGVPPEPSEPRGGQRTLSVAHFQFRGGSVAPRGPSSRTRLGEPAPKSMEADL